MDLMKNYLLFALAGVAVVAGIAMPFAGEAVAPFALFAWVGAALLASAGVIVHSPRWGTLSSAAIAAGASGYLLWLKVKGGTAICTINATIDCEAINESPYSVLLADTPIETPITLLGLAFFVGLAAAAMLASDKTSRLFQVSAIFGLFNILVSLYLASILVIEFKVCIFCISIYLSNFLIIWAAFKGLKQSGMSITEDVGSLFTSKSMLSVVGVFAVVLIGGELFVHQDDVTEITADQTKPKDLSKYFTELPTDAMLKLDGTEPAQGPDDAAYQVVEFADYACPHCADASSFLHRNEKLLTDVKLMFKVFPLTKECNPAIPADAPSNFPPRCIAAVVAECAHYQGRFWDVNHDLFTNQAMLANSNFQLDDLKRLAKNRGVDVLQLDQCVNNPDSIRGVGMDAVAGARAGVQGTPAFFVKGVTEDGKWVMVNGSAEAVLDLLDDHRFNKKLAAESAPADAPIEAPTDEAPTEAPVEEAPVVPTEEGATDAPDEAPAAPTDEAAADAPVEEAPATEAGH